MDNRYCSRCNVVIALPAGRQVSANKNIKKKPILNKKTIPDNFGGLAAEYSDYHNSDTVIIPVPFDMTSSWMKGSSKGPKAIVDASKHMELYDIETDSEVYTKGIHTAKAVRSRTSSSMINTVHKEVKQALKDRKFPVVLGGEHTVSLGAVRAHAENNDRISILHLDAHADMRDTYEGDKFSHASVMARCREITEDIVSVGIRSMDSSELGNIIKKNIFYASEIRGSGEWIKKAASKLSKNVYITIDLDVFDPSIMPSTGTPEPGGPGWYEVLDLLGHVAKKRNIIGFDVVELCPSDNPAPDFIAAKLIYKLLSLIFN